MIIVTLKLATYPEDEEANKEISGRSNVSWLEYDIVVIVSI